MKKYASFDLTGKVAVIFGGTRGIGRAIALGLAQYGAKIAPISRTLKNSEKVAKEASSWGVEAVSAAIDVTDYERVKSFRDELLEKFGHIDILVNSQGAERRGTTIELSLENWREVLKVQLESVFMTCKIFGEVMVKQKSGKVINIASMGSFRGIAGSPVYCACKGGVNQLTKVCALEWAKDNVQVNAIAPGWFRTKLTEPVFSNIETANAIISKIPVGKPGNCEELAGAAIFLASQASDYTTGTTMIVDGGFMALGI